MKPVKILAVFVLCAIVLNRSYAQGLPEKYYQRALEDSLVRYEFLKPAYLQLKTDFTDVQIQNVSLYGELQTEKLQHKATGDQLQRAESGQNKKWWNGFYWGWAGGAITTTILLLK